MFEPTTTAKITTIFGITDKTCTPDPIPTKQLNDNMENVVPVITYTTNASLENAVMPVVFKQAIVRPLLKKQSLDKDILNKYHPVSNLTQLSKVIEKVIARRITSHISDQRVEDCFQSGYRKKKHSTETALLC